MSYVKQTWQTGDVVTSAKLNHMEDGIAAGGGSGGGGVLVVTATLNADETGTCDKTMGEIWAAAQTMPVILVENFVPVGIIGITTAVLKYTDEPSYILKGVNANYRATSLDDYPSISIGDDSPHT
jgi:hypothetical protein